MKTIKKSTMKMLTICGAALPNVETILYRPFHDFIRRRTRKTRSMRRMRRNDKLPMSALA